MVYKHWNPLQIFGEKSKKGQNATGLRNFTWDGLQDGVGRCGTPAVTGIYDSAARRRHLHLKHGPGHPSTKQLNSKQA
ncbi:Hypothetical protein NTJ_14420 [Nesidiocoris tenuis]|uniref:Uncharacterized protein n=1 Tax=Nesidiocoris tenuis TaxID=355587 RepID=A0ABN7BBG3_9HEMI|nr:Hypothetical protein NTJ_14420 [Nesidiocoris tenuis]